MILDLLKTYERRARTTHPYSDTLNILGTGGGNDIFSAIMIAMFFTKIDHSFKKIRILGMLSPAATHINTDTKIKYDGNIYNSPQQFFNPIERQICTKDGVQSISLVDNLIPEIIDTMKHLDLKMYSKLSICEIVHINSYSGIAFKEIYNKYGQEPFLGVDVGGDIFAGIDDFDLKNNILSPLLDFSAFVLLKNIKDSHLLEIGLGTDGESGPIVNKKSNTYKKLKKYTNAQFVTVQQEIDVISIFKTLYKRICQIRKGHTLDFLLKGIDLDLNKKYIYPSPKTLTQLHRYSYKNVNPEVIDEFNVEIDIDIINECFIIPLCELNQKLEIPFNLNHYSYEDNAVQTAEAMKEKFPNWSTEIDGHYLKDGTVFYGKLSKRIPKKEVDRLINCVKCKTGIIII